MENVLLVIGLLSCIALIASVLLQRSEGGALGMGGGGGGLVSSRGAADTLVRATMVLAAIFFCSSLALTRINADKSRDASEVIRRIEDGQGSGLTEVVDPNAIPDISTIDSPDIVETPSSDEASSDETPETVNAPLNDGGAVEAEATNEAVDAIEADAEIPAEK